jgi:hypothetical protein
VKTAAADAREDGDTARPPCYHCGEAYASVDAARHAAPVNCEVCPRCRGMPACYTCRNMYCACEAHQY